MTVRQFNESFGGWSRSGIELERRPVERTVKGRVVKQRQFGGPQSDAWSFSFVQFCVELVDELRGGDIAYVPERADYVMSAGAKESPR
jgi:hypothetical protein